MRRRRRPLADAAWTPTPRSTRTYPTRTAWPGPNGLRPLPTTPRPSEEEETAVPGGGDEIAFFRPFVDLVLEKDQLRAYRHGHENWQTIISCKQVVIRHLFLLLLTSPQLEASENLT